MSNDLVKQITVYLSNGGLFNPEMMDHDKVRNLLMDCRDRIEKLEAALREIAAGYETPWSTSTVSNMLNVAEILSDRINIAREALEGEDD